MGDKKKWQDMEEVPGEVVTDTVDNKTPIKHEVHMDASVATFWYGKYTEFTTTNAGAFKDLTFAQYLGEQVLTNLMRLMEGTVPE